MLFIVHSRRSWWCRPQTIRARKRGGRGTGQPCEAQPSPHPNRSLMLHVQDVEPAHLEVEGHLEAPRLDQLEDPLVSRTSPWRCSVGRRARRPTARHVQSTARPEARGRMVSQLRTYGKRYSDFKRRLAARRSHSPLAGSHSPSPFPLAAARLPLALSHGATGIFAGATGPFPKGHSPLYTGDSTCIKAHPRV